MLIRQVILAHLLNLLWLLRPAALLAKFFLPPLSLKYTITVNVWSTYNNTYIFFARQDVLSYFYLDTCWSSGASQGSFHISFLTCIQWTPVNSIIIQLYDQLFLFCSDLIIKNLEALRFNSHRRSYLMWLVLSSSPYETSFYLTDLSGNRKKKFK